VNQGKPWGSLGYEGEHAESEVPWRQDRRREKLDDDETPWMMKEFAGNGCSGWKMTERVVSVVTRGDGG
jgi:hypothetical protein